MTARLSRRSPRVHASTDPVGIALGSVRATQPDILISSPLTIVKGCCAASGRLTVDASAAAANTLWNVLIWDTPPEGSDARMRPLVFGEHLIRKAEQPPLTRLRG